MAETKDVENNPEAQKEEAKPNKNGLIPGQEVPFEELMKHQKTQRKMLDKAKDELRSRNVKRGKK